MGIDSTEATKTLGVVGLGLIGGSMAKDLGALGYKVIGYDAQPTHAHQALDLNIISEIMELDELAQRADIIIVAIPVKETGAVIKALLDQIKWHTVVLDTGSTKNNICQAVRSTTKRGRFVASHPLAGTEFSGPQAAISHLFNSKKNIICEEHLSDEDALDSVIHLYRQLGMQSIFMDPFEHDKHMAYVSHLSHVSAFTLGTTVLDIEKDQKQIFNLASTGFESTVRLAKSSPYTWSSIFADNADHLLEALTSYIQELETFKSALESRDEEQMRDIISRANEIKRVLNGMKYNIVKLS